MGNQVSTDHLQQENPNQLLPHYSINQTLQMNQSHYNYTDSNSNADTQNLPTPIYIRKDLNDTIDSPVLSACKTSIALSPLKQEISILPVITKTASILSISTGDNKQGDSDVAVNQLEKSISEQPFVRPLIETLNSSPATAVDLSSTSNTTLISPSQSNISVPSTSPNQLTVSSTFNLSNEHSTRLTTNDNIESPDSVTSLSPKTDSPTSPLSSPNPMTAIMQNLGEPIPSSRKKKITLAERRSHSVSGVSSSFLSNQDSSDSTTHTAHVTKSLPRLKPPRLNTQIITQIAAKHSPDISPLSANSTQQVSGIVDLCIQLHNINYLPIWCANTIQSGSLLQLKKNLKTIFQTLQQLDKKRVDSLKYPISVAYLPSSIGLNRYRDIVPFDYNRINLISDGSDYINASMLTSLDQQKRYIATQGPLPESFGDFWQMVWEQNSSMIVMLTKEEESGRTKCHRYWPEFIGQSRRYHKVTANNSICFKITFVEDVTLMNGTTIVRELVIKRDMLIQDQDAPLSPEIRRVRMVQYLAWPDHDSCDIRSLLSLIDLVNEINIQSADDTVILTSNREPFQPGPMVIHCSAGVGRTGTFCAIDTVLHQLSNRFNLKSVELSDKLTEEWNQLPVDDLVAININHYRSQRSQIVQTFPQLQLCYMSIIMKIGDWYNQKRPISWTVLDKDHHIIDSSTPNDVLKNFWYRKF
ncbi:hypothetical protein HDV02_001664 [Globomyces sp. JEL0801]|nr:hypothetical protein HDV02_001664 [Globomyces sp. JEL0801]